MFKTFLIIALLIAQSSAFTVWFNNINQADSTAVPILDNTGMSIEGGFGYVAAGTFSNPPGQITDFGEFQTFGEGTSSFNGVAPGFFDIGRSAPIPEGTTSSPVGERIYVVIGDGNSLSTSTDFAVFDSGLTFGTENLLGLGAVDVNITSDFLTEDKLLVGDLLTNVDTGLGVNFDKAIQLTTVRQPIAPVLSPDLKDFYQSERGETLSVDATPLDGFPSTFTYQWSYNGVDYPSSLGGRRPIINFSGNTLENGKWKVIVTNDAGSTDHTFDYRVYIPEPVPPTIRIGNYYETSLNQPVSIDATPIAGYPIDFEYQWYLNGSAIAADQGGQERIFQLLGSADENGTWKVVVTNASGSTEHSFDYQLFNDLDGDGLSDYREQNILGTNFELADSDSDGLSDAVEVNGLTNPTIADTDNDGLLDGAEVSFTETDPLVADSDGDGIPDGEDDKDSDGLTNAQEVIVHKTNPLLADSDNDGLSDSTEVQLQLDPNIPTNVEDIVNDFRKLQVAYDAVIVDRDSRFIDTDGDGITDIKESQMNTDTEKATVFYLQDAYEFGVNTSRLSGQADVTANPQNFELTTLVAYNQMITERDSRFIDSDGDGLTDSKEIELFSDLSKETTYYLQDSYNTAVANAREAGLIAVLSNPQNYKLKTEDAYNLVVDQRDARFEDTDRDGITDIKEIELETDPNEGTIFSLETTGFDAIAAARQVGRNDVMVFPFGYGLASLDDYNKVIAERDERFSDSDGDGLTDLKEAELETSPLLETAFFLRPAFNTAVDDALDKGRREIIENPQNFNLTTIEAFNTVISERDARPTAETHTAVIAERDARYLDSDGDGITDLKEEELVSDPDSETNFFLEQNQQTTLQESRTAGQNDVLSNPQNFDLTTRAAFNIVVAQRDNRFLDSDRDGLTDDKEGELGTDSATQTSFYLENAFNNLFTDAKGSALDEILANLQNFGLTTKQAYDVVVQQRDSRFLDSDGDGLTDEKESELATDPSERTNFFLDGAYRDVIAESLQNGRDEVTTNPQNFNLTANTAYNTLLAQRNERFLDSDGDGLTDVIEKDLETDPNVKTIFSINSSPRNFIFAQAQTKNEETQTTSESPDFALSTTEEDQFADSDSDGITDAKEEELNTDPNTKTVFYLQNALDNALTASRDAGRNDVTSNPQNYELTPNTAYATLITERDSLFLDSDGDGITDSKENELKSNASEKNNFYLQDAYESGLTNARKTGQIEVITNPQVYNFKTQEAYDIVVSQRDARFIDTDGDGLTDEKESQLKTNPQEETDFYLQNALDDAVATAKIQGRDQVTTNPSNFDLTSQSLYNLAIAQRDSRPTEEAYQAIVAQRDGRFVDSDSDGITDTKEAELSSNPQETNIFYLESAYQDAVLNARITGRNDVTTNPLNYALTTYNAYLVAANQRDLRPTTAAYNSILAQRDSRPTREEFNTVTQERDERPTIEEVKDARLGSVVLEPSTADNKVKLRFSIEETDDLTNWTKRPWGHVISLPLETGKKFYRFALENE